MSISSCRWTFWEQFTPNTTYPENLSKPEGGRTDGHGQAWGGHKTLSPICPCLVFPTIFNALSLQCCTKSLSPLICHQGSLTSSSLKKIWIQARFHAFPIYVFSRRHICLNLHFIFCKFSWPDRSNRLSVKEIPRLQLNLLGQTWNTEDKRCHSEIMQNPGLVNKLWISYTGSNKSRYLSSSSTAWAPSSNNKKTSAGGAISGFWERASVLAALWGTAAQ